MKIKLFSLAFLLAMGSAQVVVGADDKNTESKTAAAKEKSKKPEKTEEQRLQEQNAAAIEYLLKPGTLRTDDGNGKERADEEVQANYRKAFYGDGYEHDSQQYAPSAISLGTARAMYDIKNGWSGVFQSDLAARNKLVDAEDRRMAEQKPSDGKKPKHPRDLSPLRKPLQVALEKEYQRVHAHALALIANTKPKASSTDSSSGSDSDSDSGGSLFGLVLNFGGKKKTPASTAAGTH